LGLARGLVDTIHTYNQYYDFVVDSTYLSAYDCAQLIMQFINNNSEPTGFMKMRELFKVDIE
jgi:hypothetical protein